MRRVAGVMAVLVALGVIAWGGWRYEAAAHAPQRPPALVPAVPVRPSTFTVNGYAYNCDQVRQLVSEDENYTPDGHYIYAVLLMDCDI